MFIGLLGLNGLRESKGFQRLIGADGLEAGEADVEAPLIPNVPGERKFLNRSSKLGRGKAGG